MTEAFSLKAKDPNSRIPEGGIVKFSSDGITRVFNAQGEQILDVRDSNAQMVMTPSGKMIPATHVFSVPEDVIVYNSGNRDYYIRDEKILFIKDFGDEKDGDLVNKIQGLPGPLGNTWVAYAESDSITNPAILTSQLVVPHSPSTSVNILFNGLQPEDGSYIVQPVVAFNYNQHNGNGLRWQNQWTGASWLCDESVTCDHGDPVLAVNEGDTINGAVGRVPLPGPIPDLWVITTTDITSGQSTTYLKFYKTTSPSQVVTTYEIIEGYLDRLKISDTPFTNIVARDTSFNSIPLTMHGQYHLLDHPHLTGLYVDTSQSPSKITIFTDYSFSITTTTEGNGEIKPTEGEIIPSGIYSIKTNEDKEFTITPNSGYIIDNVLVDGQSKGPLSTYSFRLVNPEDMKDHTISAIFKEKTLPAIVPLCQAGEAFDATLYPQGWPQSDPMTFTCDWDGNGRVYVSGSSSELIGTHADDGFTVDTPNGIQFDAEGHYAHQHAPLDITEGMNSGSNTLTLIVRNYMGLSMSYGSSTGIGTDQVPYIVEINDPSMAATMRSIVSTTPQFTPNSTSLEGAAFTENA
ncbi:hypothetical protein [Methanoregula sp.]|uniref:hypothetical protein n=1 Tax=Methanoregula sp. TaxID=2052170 RepID=UPI00263A246A|nr:hypothetical protein [Methanoregula sp.]MDD5143040.1 hypothetical protein [Methanoregula sp.]